MTVNEWSTHYGKRRRAIDKAILQDCERRLTSPDDAAPCADDRFSAQATRAPKPPERPSTLDPNDSMRLTISRAFGRPIA